MTAGNRPGTTRLRLAYCLAKSRRYSGGRYSCTLPKDHGGSHRCDTIRWDASGDVRTVKP